MIIGRETEQEILKRCLCSKESEFIAVYGRRRVGKTFMIREFFTHEKCIFFYSVGQFKKNMATQLKNFTDALAETFYKGAPLRAFRNWDEAFHLLNSQISQSKGKVIIFLDELPWLATARSGLIQTVEYYWNRHWQHSGNVILVVCGSSASWIIKNIIKNKGGLHNRLTQKIRLHPFTLLETKKFLYHQKIRLHHLQIVKIYMAIGGIPFYLKLLQPGLTAEQNIQLLFFSDNASLRDEFTDLFKSLFNDANPYIELIRLISKKRNGVALVELREQVKLTSIGGHLTNRLNDLVEAGFISENVIWGQIHGEFYKLVDEFCLFYLTWVNQVKKKALLPDYWQTQASKQSYKIWTGYAFEILCLKHLPLIAKTLKITCSGVVGTWAYIAKTKSEMGAQIDLVIDRQDNAITLCEIKFYDKPFKIDKEIAKSLMNKVKIFETKTKTAKQVFLALITANGLAPSIYNEDIVDGLVVMSDLFCE